MDQQLNSKPDRARQKPPIIFIVTSLIVFSGLAGLVMMFLGFVFGFSMSARDILWGFFCTVVIPAYIICTNYRAEKS